MSVASDPTADLQDFPGREELEQLLVSLLPQGWIEGVRSADDAAIQRLKSEVHNPSIVAVLGAAGWVAPHYDIDHGGRGRAPTRRAMRSRFCRCGRCRTCLEGRGFRSLHQRFSSGRQMRQNAGCSHHCCLASNAGASCFQSQGRAQIWHHLQPPQFATVMNGW